MDFFGNFVYDNKKNKEYFKLKGGYTLSSKFVDKHYHIFFKNNKLIKACCSTLGNIAVTQDDKIQLWVLGAIPNLISII